MNAPTLIILILIVTLCIMGIRYLRRVGTCGECASKGSCSGSCNSVPRSRDPEVREKLKRIDSIIEKHESREMRR